VGSTSKLLAAVALAVLTAGCAATDRGPVDRSVDTAHATTRTTGETASGVRSGPRNAVVSLVTFPFKLVGRGLTALFGP
jgi:hypothetical protein